MESIKFENVNLAELLPRIPDSVKNSLPFGIVKMDLKGTILEYNMAEGALTGTDPRWAIGKNFFDDVAKCTKTQAFYGRFVDGVKKGFLNVVFEYVFDHQKNATKVKVHMFTMPDSSGKKTVVLLVKRATQPLVINAVPERDFERALPNGSPSAATPKSEPSVQDVVNAVMTAMNQNVASAAMAASAPTAPAASAPVNVIPAASKRSRHQDILQF